LASGVEQGETRVKIILLSEERIQLDATPGPLTVEAASAEMVYSPFHMMASGLATCIFSILQSWASNTKLPANDLQIEIGWEFADAPKRVGRYEVEMIWPSLPESRRAAALRAASLCPVHKTLEHPPEIGVELKG
jgi:putative redox protein